MKIKIDDKKVFELTEVKKNILKHVFFDEDLESEVERLVVWILDHNIKMNLKKLKEEWVPKMKDLGIKSVPTDDEEFVDLVFSQKDYKNRSQRDKKFPDKITKFSDIPPGR